MQIILIIIKWHNMKTEEFISKTHKQFVKGTVNHDRIIFNNCHYISLKAW